MSSVAARTHWERVATTRWGAYLTTAERDAFEHALSLAGAPGAAMEVGAEGGRWSRLLSDRGWRLRCTDVDPEALEICAERLPDAECVVVDPDDTTLPAESGSIKLLVVIEVPPVVEAAWFPQEAHRVLEPGGVLITTTFNPVSARGLAYRLLLRLGRRHHRAYRGPSYSTFRRRLASAGLSIVHERGYTWFPFTRDSDSRLIPYAATVERVLRLGRMPALSPFVIVIARK